MDDIATSGFWKGMPEYTEAEVDLVVEFCEARQRGEDPDPEEYLARCPEHRDRLAALLEGEQVIAGHFKRVQDKCPGLCPRRFLGLPASLR